ncbi:MAG: outer membrane beta-barrel family protein [Alistipes sp.]
MRHLILLFLFLATIVPAAQAAHQSPVTGRVVDQNGNPIAYATVVLLKNKTQAAGIATDSEGQFSLTVPAGDYTFSIQYLGFDPLQQPIHIENGMKLGTFTLKESTTKLKEVVVTAQTIRREADRFVVTLNNSPVALGKDGVEILQTAPGVWINDDKISINGKTGSKIYINDRELKMEGEQLMAYLRTLRAEDMQKIEVIPISGADYDADSASGIIKITLKHKRDDGLDGSLSYTTAQGHYINQHSPRGNINYHQGKVNLYASAWGQFAKHDVLSKENTHYNNINSAIEASSDLLMKYNSGGGSIGGIFELNAKHSLGAEVEYWHTTNKNITTSTTDITDLLDNTHQASLYQTHSLRNNFSATFNYIWKIDTLGSTLKVIADYTRRSSDQNDNYFTAIAAATYRDSTYRNLSDDLYNIATASLAYEKVFSPKWTLKAGAKYTNNDMKNSANYAYIKESAWQPTSTYDYDISYTEHIAALYAIVNAKIGRIGFAAGLRGEYTHTIGRGEGIKRNYVSLFPNANISWTMDKAGKHSLIASYARTIGRPSFWAITPNRMQISDYTYQIGNPDLRPTYNNSLSLTLVVDYKYTFSAGLNINTDGFAQIMASDPKDPRNLIMTFENLPTNNTYYLSVNLPFQLTKWWSWNVNLIGMRQALQIDSNHPVKHYNLLMANTSMNFTLPAKFFFEVSYSGQTTAYSGNVCVHPRHILNASIKKRFCKDRFTATFAVNSILNQPTEITTTQDDFVRNMNVRQSWGSRTYQIGLSYNFKSGKAFRKQSVESGSQDEKGRL